ncbi:hypothetical protein AGMMS49928_00630 [Spirochaetia bacterium]|nr:hypothetical protein AGMMS49928_00630 [Spirochaetia bacterium]
MAAITINGKIFNYKEVALSWDTNVPFNKNDAKELLLKTKEVLDRHGLLFCLATGTLLGAVRDKDFITGDEDIDIFIYAKDKDRLISLIPELNNNDIKLCRIGKNHLYSFMYKGKCYVDIYILKSFKFSLFGIYCYDFNTHAMPKKYFREIQEIDFLGTTFNCPKDPVRWLEFLYGKTWNIPIKGHNFRYEVYPAYLYRKIKNYIKKIVKALIGYKYWHKNK